MISTIKQEVADRRSDTGSDYTMQNFLELITGRASQRNSRSPPSIEKKHVPLLKQKSTAERFWSNHDLRHLLFDYPLPRGLLVQMMVLEKAALPDVASALYRTIDRIDMVEYLVQRGCPPVSSWSLLSQCHIFMTPVSDPD